MDKFFYEGKPYFCIFLGSWALHTYHMHPNGVYPADLLILCGIFILALRIEYRFFGNTPPNRNRDQNRRNFRK